MGSSKFLYILTIMLVIINAVSTYGMELTYVERSIISIPITLSLVGAFIVDAIEKLKEK